MLNSELKKHLENDESHNKRSGNCQKTITTETGSFKINVPRDRNSSFESVIFLKRQRKFDNFNQKVISLYVRGMTVSDIKAQLQELYHGNEGAKFWLNNLTEMKSRGLQDILVACSDNLISMFDAIQTVFSKT